MKTILKKIKSIQRNSVLEKCFDVSVFKNENFLLSDPVNLISHNSNALGEQFLRGACVLKNTKLPNYELCQKGSCSECKNFNSCLLLRAEYERKKSEGFELLRQYVKNQLAARPNVVSPYAPMGLNSQPDDSLVPENLAPENPLVEKYVDGVMVQQPRHSELFRNQWGQNVLSGKKALNSKKVVNYNEEEESDE